MDVTCCILDCGVRSRNRNTLPRRHAQTGFGIHQACYPLAFYYYAVVVSKKHRQLSFKSAVVCKAAQSSQQTVVSSDSICTNLCTSLLVSAGFDGDVSRL